MKIFLTGYQKQSPAELVLQCAKLDAHIVDIRFKAYSPNPNFSVKGLRELLGDKYHHIKAFGNSRFKEGGIEIADFEEGLKLMLQLPCKNVILMCACADPTHCHRSVVGSMLRKRGFKVDELRPAEPTL